MPTGIIQIHLTQRIMTLSAYSTLYTPHQQEVGTCIGVY